MLQKGHNLYIFSETSLLVLSLFCIVMMKIYVMSPTLCVDLHFYIYVIMFTLDFVQHKRFRLIQFWLLGFVFIILSEMIIISEDGKMLNSYIDSLSYILFANDFFLTSYLFYNPPTESYLKVRQITNEKLFNLSAIIFTIIYIILHAGLITKAIYEGSRGGSSDITSGSGGVDLFAIFFGGLSLLLPALIAMCLKMGNNKNGILYYIMAISIIMLQMLGGTRFMLLFAALPFLIVLGVISVNKQSMRRHTIAVSTMIILAMAANFAKEVRNFGILEYQNKIEYLDDNYPHSFLGNAAREMSPEGCVKMNRMAMDYFSSHDFHYGKETAFILYFWIPRSIWKDKPVMLDYWLIRKYEDVAVNHSSASGFMGEIFADFGYFSLVVLIIWGCVLKRMELYVYKVFSVKGPILDKVFASSLFPYVFFFIRSPLTSTMQLISVFVIYLLISKFYTKKEVLYINSSLKIQYMA